MSPIAILSHLILKRFNIFLFSRSPVSYIRSILTFSDETALEINVRRNTMCHQGCPEKMLTISMSQFYSSLVTCSNSSILTIFQERGDISGQSTRLSTTNTALRAVKEAEKHDKSHVDFSRQCGKSPVTTSAVLNCVYLVWKHPRRRIEVTF